MPKAATPMFGCCRSQPQVVAYQPRQPKVNLDAVNGETAFGVSLSKTMDFDDYDRADENQLNRILWTVAKGENVVYSPIVRRASMGN